MNFGPSKILRGRIATKRRYLSKRGILANLVVCNLTKWLNLISSVTYPHKYYNDREKTNKQQQQPKTQGLSNNMRKSVSKLKKKEFIYKKGSYKDDHLYVQTSTKFFYNSKQKNPKNECTLRNECIIRCPNDLTPWFKVIFRLVGLSHFNTRLAYEYPD